METSPAESQTLGTAGYEGGVGLGSRPSRLSVWTLLLGVSTYLTVEGAIGTYEVISSKPLSNFSNLHPQFHNATESAKFWTV